MVQHKKKINVKERFADGEIDLSMSNLDDVPVTEIASMKKVVESLDVSNNRLVYLPANFTILTNLTKLDLSKNELKELPENFGNLYKLKHLDLYNNKLQHLPLSFGQLVNLKFLDLKYNPLFPAIEKIAGQCLDTKDCQQCAKNIVQFYKKLEREVADEKEIRQKTREKQLEINKQKNKKEQENKKDKKGKDKKVEKDVELIVGNKKQIKKETTKKQKQRRKANKTKGFKIPLCIFILISIFVFWIFMSLKLPVAEQISDYIGNHYNRVIQKLPAQYEHYGTATGQFIKTFQEHTKHTILNMSESINHYIFSIIY